jgi:predicted nucleic acid-binding protein
VRALLDTNVYVGYLLTPGRTTSPVVITVDAAFANRYAVLLPGEIPRELVDAIVEDAYLSNRIGRDQAVRFVALLRGIAEEFPSLTGPVPAVTGDEDDDFILAQALIAGADYLVTGDKHLLALDGRVDPLRIVTPAEFARILAGLEQSPEESEVSEEPDAEPDG